MKIVARLRRYVALKTYETRQAWASSKEDATELLHDWSFRCRIRISTGWPFRPLAKLHSQGVKNSQGFGKFDGKWEELSVYSDDPIFDKKNDPIFSKEAGLRAFEHVKLDDVDDKNPRDGPQRTEAEELIQVRARLADSIKAMQAAEARRVARLKIVAGIVVLALIGLALLLFTQ
jgi:hypothetical protein